MPEQMGQKLVFAFGAVNLAQLRTADAAEVDLHQHLAVARLDDAQPLLARLKAQRS